MNIPTSFKEALDVLDGRSSRKVGNNTYLTRIAGDYVNRIASPDAVGLVLHHTTVVTYWRDRRLVLNSGGWRTVTTKDRINRVLRSQGYNLVQRDYRWLIVNTWNDGEVEPFFDGITLEARHD